MTRKFAKIFSILLATVFLTTITMTADIVQAATFKLTAKVKTSTSVTLSWSYVSGASGYRLYRATSKAGTYKTVVTQKLRSYTNKGLTTNKTYYFKVRSYRLKGKTKIFGKYSNIASIKPFTATPKPSPTPTPFPTNAQGFKKVNVIYMIGDGMGENHVTATRIIYAAQGKSLVMDTITNKGSINTMNINGTITDSAAAGTALACGYRTVNEMVGVDRTGKEIESILERAQVSGFKTGIISTKFISDATPAAFTAHAISRSDYTGIAAQIIEQRPNIIFGGGRQYFTTNTLTRASALGYNYIQSSSNIAAAQGDYILGLFQPLSLETATVAPLLKDMTKKALDSLSANGNNFFLMVEGGVIDTKSHSKNMLQMTEHVKAFDEAVGVAIEFAKNNPNTIVIVTADHETGGLILPSNPTVANLTNECFKTQNHTGVNVPLYAYGLGASEVVKATLNTDIPKKIAALYGFQNFAPTATPTAAPTPTPTPLKAAA